MFCFLGCESLPLWWVRRGQQRSQWWFYLHVWTCLMNLSDVISVWFWDFSDLSMFVRSDFSQGLASIKIKRASAKVWASLVAQLLQNLPVMRETWVQSLGWDDPLKKGKAILSSILACRIPWTTVHGVTKGWTWLSDFHNLQSRWFTMSWRHQVLCF